MATTKQAQELTDQHLLHTVSGYDIEATYFRGPLKGGQYNTGATITLHIGQQHYETWLTQPLTITERNTP